MTSQSAVDSTFMLLNFRARNVRSFRDEFELSLIGTRVTEPGVGHEINWPGPGKSIVALPAAVLFGANGAGKTNVLRAVADMQEFVLDSFRRGPHTGTGRQAFALDRASRAASSSFELDVVLEGVRYSYGFEVDDDEVIAEWIHHYPKGRVARILVRNHNTIEHHTGPASQLRQIETLLRPNALFLSTAAAANYAPVLRLYEWFVNGIEFADASNRSQRQTRAAQLASTESSRVQVLRMLRAADLGISNVRLDRQKLPSEVIERMPAFFEGDRGMFGAFSGEEREGMTDDRDFSEVRAELLKGLPTLRLEHQGEEGGVPFELERESYGTTVWLGMIGPVIDALSHGTLLLADEIDLGLHPALIVQLVRLFQSKSTNPHGAQLIFTSHDASLLGVSHGVRPLGRDQIWFTEKRNDGSSRLFPLLDLEPRKEESIERRYLEGRYGGVPIVSRQEFAAVAERILDEAKA